MRKVLAHYYSSHTVHDSTRITQVTALKSILKGSAVPRLAFPSQKKMLKYYTPASFREFPTYNVYKVNSETRQL